MMVLCTFSFSLPHVCDGDKAEGERMIESETASRIAVSEYDIIGIWEATSGLYQVQIMQISGLYCGKIIWLKESLDYQGKPIRDWLNPNPSLRGQYVTGSKCISGLQYHGGSRFGSGKVYDFISGKRYSAYIELESKNKARLRGFTGIPLFGQTEYFYRVK
ncbi:MAG: hypothetical protein ACI959_001196 [Limisphaerales bacterium]|jgi:uncharacterized protein (DUF2147 family)